MEHKLNYTGDLPVKVLPMFPPMWPWPHSKWQAWHQRGFVSEGVGGQGSQPYNRSSSHHPPQTPLPCASAKTPCELQHCFIWAQDVRYGAVSYYPISTGTKATLLFPDVN